jgi:hypothetical protein
MGQYIKGMKEEDAEWGREWIDRSLSVILIISALRSSVFLFQLFRICSVPVLFSEFGTVTLFCSCSVPEQRTGTEQEQEQEQNRFSVP